MEVTPDVTSPAVAPAAPSASLTLEPTEAAACSKSMNMDLEKENAHRCTGLEVVQVGHDPKIDGQASHPKSKAQGFCWRLAHQADSGTSMFAHVSSFQPCMLYCAAGMVTTANVRKGFAICNAIVFHCACTMIPVPSTCKQACCQHHASTHLAGAARQVRH